MQLCEKTSTYEERGVGKLEKGPVLLCGAEGSPKACICLPGLISQRVLSALFEVSRC